MYYLYNKKGKQKDDQSSSTDGRTVSSQPMTVRSSGPSRRPYPIIARESHGSSSFDAPEGMDASQQSQHQLLRRRPGMSEDSECKQESKQKDEQGGRRLLRRRGLEEHDFTEEVMQPRRPNRIMCQRCHHDIGSNDNQHRIMCSDRDGHVF